MKRSPGDMWVALALGAGLLALAYLRRTPTAPTAQEALRELANAPGAAPAWQTAWQAQTAANGAPQEPQHQVAALKSQQYAQRRDMITAAPHPQAQRTNGVYVWPAQLGYPAEAYEAIRQGALEAVFDPQTGGWYALSAPKAVGKLQQELSQSRGMGEERLGGVGGRMSEY